VYVLINNNHNYCNKAVPFKHLLNLNRH
jgi:hypothetical protein